jgi:hypothetical protein
MRTNVIVAVLSLGLSLSAPAQARADNFYVMVFGAQRPVFKVARHSHSFATFVRVSPDGCTQQITISWLPVTGKLRPLAVQPEPGRNFSLEETFKLCVEQCMVVGAWGPYQIQPALWDGAVWQKARLDSGQVQYKAFDCGSPGGAVSNCIHAIEFLTRPPDQKGPSVIVAPANWGESGSYWVALALRPWFVCPCETHPWVMSRIGLNPDAFTFFDLKRNPTKNPAVLATQAALQSYLLPNRVSCAP